MDIVYLVCKDANCKVGMRIGLEENFSTDKNERREAFLDEHIKHGAFDTVTDEYFSQVLLAEGYKDVQNEQLQAVPLIRNAKSDIPDEEAPFGMPKRERSLESLTGEGAEPPLKDFSIGDYPAEKHRALVEKGVRQDRKSRKDDLYDFLRMKSHAHDRYQQCYVAKHIIDIQTDLLLDWVLEYIDKNEKGAG